MNVMLYKVKVYASGIPKEIAIEADSLEEAAARVRKQMGEERTIVVGVAPVKKSFISGLRLFKKVGSRDLELLCRNLLVLLQAGVTTLEAVETVALQTEKKSMKRALELVATNIREGFPLQNAFRVSPDVFPEVFCQVIEASEEAGALERGLASLATHFEKEACFKEKLRQAMAYPLFVAGFAVVVALGLFIFVVPKFTTLLAEANVSLPLPTRLMLAFSTHIWEVLGILVILVLLAIKGAKTAWRFHPTRLWLESLLARVPFVGRLLTRTTAARVSRTFALLLRVGIPVVQALETAEKTCPLASLQDELKVVKTVVRGGGSLSGALRRCKWLPPAVGRMAAVGERSGTLPEMLERAASLFDAEVDALMQRLPPLVEGGMVVCVGGLVLFVLLSLFLPIFSMYQTVK